MYIVYKAEASLFWAYDIISPKLGSIPAPRIIRHYRLYVYYIGEVVNLVHLQANKVLKGRLFASLERFAT